MSKFNDFACKKLLGDFRSYLEHEYRSHPKELERFVLYINEAGQSPLPTQQQPMARPVQQPQVAQPVNNGMGSAFVGQAIDKLMPNILKTAQQKNPNNYPQVQQVVKNFQNQWNQFKQQIPQLLGAQGVLNPQKHGLTYGDNKKSL